MNKRIPSSLIGISGVHHAVSELSRRGLIALPTIRNTAGYDIIVASLDGERHANIQVKASAKKVSFWPMPVPNNIRVGPNDFYVFLRWIELKANFEGFMLTGSEACREVAYNVRKQRRRVGKSRRAVFPSFHVGGMKESESLRARRKRNLRLWKTRWETWTL